MTIWHISLPALLAAATLMACLTYLITPERALTEATHAGAPNMLKTPSRDAIGSGSLDTTANEKAAAAYLQAAQAILRRAPEARASADRPSAPQSVPLPKRRPIPRS
jgi:hypothetical protein